MGKNLRASREPAGVPVTEDGPPLEARCLGGGGVRGSSQPGLPQGREARWRDTHAQMARSRMSQSSEASSPYPQSLCPPAKPSSAMPSCPPHLGRDLCV